MSLACPALDWPDRLDEAGPAEDPAILLRGRARVGDVPVAVAAIRIHPGRRLAPDYRDAVSRARYAALELEAKLDDLASLAGTDRLATVEIAGGTYAVFVVPAAGEG